MVLTHYRCRLATACITVRGDVRDAARDTVRSRATGLASDPERVVRSEWFSGARVSMVYTVATAIHTSSLDFQIRPVRRHLPKPRPDVGRSDAQFGPCPLRVLPGRVVYDWWPSRHRTHVIHTVRTPVVLQVGVFERSIVGSPRAVPYTVSGLSGETCWWNSLLRNLPTTAMPGDGTRAD